MLKVLYCQFNLFLTWRKKFSPQEKTLASLRLGERNIAMKLTNGNPIKQHLFLCALYGLKKIKPLNHQSTKPSQNTDKKISFVGFSLHYSQTKVVKFVDVGGYAGWMQATPH